ncbi:MAG: hypothetical protein ACK5ME_04200 [Parahaliea sp.]
MSDAINQLYRLSQPPVDYPALQAYLEQLVLPQDPSKEVLSRLLAALYPLVLKEAPLYNADNRSAWAVYWAANRCFEQILYPGKYGCALQVPYCAEEAAIALQPYFEWVTTCLEEDACAYLSVAWALLNEGAHSFKQAAFSWFKQLEMKGLVEPHFDRHMAQALEWTRFMSVMDPTAIVREDFEQWLLWLDHDNVILRNVAAQCIGTTYSEWPVEVLDFHGNTVVPMVEMMTQLYRWQVAGRQVVGGFIHGCCINMGGFHELETHPLLLTAGFDVKAWALATALDSPEHEPYVPGTQAFWFYLHEYFDFDADSVSQLIDGERYWLALMCATESLDYGSLDIMRPLLARLVAEAPSAIAEQAQSALAFAKADSWVQRSTR